MMRFFPNHDRRSRQDAAAGMRRRPRVEGLEARLLLAGAITEFPVPTGSTSPVAITTGPDGNLWYAEQSTTASKIGKISTAGASTLFPLPPGTYPQGLATGSDNALWFTDTGNNKIGRITTAGAVTTFGISDVPGGIAAGPDGNLWFTAQSTGASPDKVEKITPGGTITPFNLPTANGSPLRIAAGPDGNLWFTESTANKVAKINPTTGAIIEYPIPTPNSSPTGITAGPAGDGNVWFTETATNQVAKINPMTGKITEYPIPTANSGPRGIVAGPDGNLWFSESTANRIGRLTPSTGAVAETPVPTAASGADGIVTGPDGNLWFAETAANQIGQVVPANFGMAGAPVLSASSDTGASTSDGLTKNNGSAAAPLTFTVSNVAPATGFVRLYDVTNPGSPVPLAGPVQASNGSATLTVTGHALTDGVHKFAATTATTANGPEGAKSPATAITIQTSVSVTSFSPAGNFYSSTNQFNNQVVIHFSHPLAGFTPDDPTGGGVANDPYAFFLLPSGPDGATTLANNNTYWSGASGYDGGPLPLHATVIYHENADGTSQVTIIPRVPLSTDIYLVSVSGSITDKAGNPLSDAQGHVGTVYSSFDLRPTSAPNAPTVTGVTTSNGGFTINNNLSPQPDTIGIRFSKPMDTWTINSSTVQLLANNTVIKSAVAYSPTTQSAYLTPEAPLTPGTVYLIRVDGSVTDDQNFPGLGVSLAGGAFYDTFTVATGGVASQAPLRVARDGNNQVVAQPVPYSAQFNNTQWPTPVGYAAVKFTEPISLASLGRYSVRFFPTAGGLNNNTADVGDLPLNAKLAFNPNTNQLIIVPTEPVGNGITLIAVDNVKAANADGSPNAGDPLIDPNGLPVYFSFFINAPGSPGVPGPSGTLTPVTTTGGANPFATTASASYTWQKSAATTQAPTTPIATKLQQWYDALARAKGNKPSGPLRITRWAAQRSKYWNT